MKWRQDRETGKLVEVVRQDPYRGHYLRISDVDFISPVDGSHIGSRQQLVDHNKKHGVSNDLDSLREQTQREMQRVPNTGSREDRIAAIRETIEKLQ